MAPPARPRDLTAVWLGQRPYTEVLELQEQLFAARRLGQVPDQVLLVEHPAVLTLGRSTHPEHILATPEALAAQGVDQVSIGRGGDVTLHAPGQLVAYPILDLSPDRCDVRRYVSDLAETMRRIIGEYGIQGGLAEGLVGLWVDADRPGEWSGPQAAQRLAKIGAIGVRISRWITMHGFALNLSIDLSRFNLIVPCGIREHPVTSVAALVGQAPTVAQAAQRAFVHLAAVLGATPLEFVDRSTDA